MARRIENECAYCAEEIEGEHETIGKDWKVYCSKACTEMGEIMSDREWQKLMSVAVPTRDYFPAEENLTPAGNTRNRPSLYLNLTPA